MQLLHALARTHASFDDPNLVSRAGLVPVMALAERAGLFALAREHVTVAGPCAANADLKVGRLVAEMAAGADSTNSRSRNVEANAPVPGRTWINIRRCGALLAEMHQPTCGTERRGGRLTNRGARGAMSRDAATVRCKR